MSSPPPEQEPKRTRRRERLAPPPTAGGGGERVDDSASRGGRTGWMLALAIILTGLLFWLLPRWAERLNEDEPATETTQSRAPAESTASNPRQDALERERSRQAATELLELAQSARDSLAERAPELWTDAELVVADAQLDEGRGFLDADRPERARESLASALVAYEQIDANAEAVLASAISETRVAFEAGDAASAEAALKRAAAVAPENAEVLVLSERLEVLPRVRERLERARVAERESRWDAAATSYAEALAMDGATESARRGLARVRSQQRESGFRRAVADVSTALDAEDVETASAALDRARSMRPSAAELGPLGQRLAAAATRRKSALLATQGRELELQERWQEALAKHEQALALSPHSATSLEARARCTTRASLSRRIEGHLTRSDRLSAPEVLDEARALLAEAKTVDEAGPRHRELIARLALAIEAAAAPVSVTLESDGLTEVTIRRVGRLGTFHQRTLELRPGTYVVTGKRSGYRDIRRELVVQAGIPAPRLPVSCDERI